MKIFAIALFATIEAQGCYWDDGRTGQNVRCMPDFYIKGGCESGSQDACRVGAIGVNSAFGVKCCPADSNVPLTNRREDDCTWTMLNS